MLNYRLLLEIKAIKVLSKTYLNHLLIKELWSTLIAPKFLLIKSLPKNDHHIAVYISFITHLIKLIKVHKSSIKKRLYVLYLGLCYQNLFLLSKSKKYILLSYSYFTKSLKFRVTKKALRRLAKITFSLKKYMKSLLYFTLSSCKSPDINRIYGSLFLRVNSCSFSLKLAQMFFNASSQAVSPAESLRFCKLKEQSKIHICFISSLVLLLFHKYKGESFMSIFSRLNLIFKQDIHCHLIFTYSILNYYEHKLDKHQDFILFINSIDINLLTSHLNDFTPNSFIDKQIDFLKKEFGPLLTHIDTFCDDNFSKYLLSKFKLWSIQGELLSEYIIYRNNAFDSVQTSFDLLNALENLKIKTDYLPLSKNPTRSIDILQNHKEILIDTNVLLYHLDDLKQFLCNSKNYLKIYIPEVILKELYNHKWSDDPRKSINSSECFKWIESNNETSSVYFQDSPAENRISITIIRPLYTKLTEYISNDNILMDECKKLPESLLISNDINLLNKCRINGIDAKSLNNLLSSI